MSKSSVEVSNEPYLDPANRIKMTEEPQATGSLGGHKVTHHLRVFSQEGVGERTADGKPAKAEKKAEPKAEKKSEPAKAPEKKAEAKKAEPKKPAGDRAGDNTSKKGN